MVRSRACQRKNPGRSRARGRPGGGGGACASRRQPAGELKESMEGEARRVETELNGRHAEESMLLRGP